MKKVLSITLLLLLITSVSAAQIQIFHSPSCPHCRNYIDMIERYDLPKHFSNYDWLMTDTTIEKSDVKSVPTTKITTLDGRCVEFVGNRPQKLLCELMEMSTMECETYPADYSTGRSFFIN